MSPKNKGKFGKGTSQVEETDEFVSGVNKIFNKLTPHAKRIGVTIGVIVVGFLGYVIYDWYQDRSERQGTEAYIAASDILRHQVVVGDGLSPDEPVPDADEVTPADRKLPTYKTTKEHAEVSLVALKKLSSEFGDSAAAAQGKLLEARVLLDLGRNDEALKIYQSYVSDAPTELIRTLAREGAGYALEAKAVASSDAGAREAGLRQALEAFRKVQPKEKATRWHYGRYHEARLLAALDEKAKATELYQKILDTEPPAALEDSITGRMAMLEAKPVAAEAPENEGGDTNDANETEHADGDKNDDNDDNDKNGNAAGSPSPGE